MHLDLPARFRREPGGLRQIGGAGLLRPELVPEHLARPGGDGEVDGLDLGMRGDPPEDVAGQEHPGGTGDEEGDAVRHGPGSYAKSRAARKRSPILERPLDGAVPGGWW